MQGQMGQDKTTRLRKYLDLLPRRILAICMIDHLVRHGIVPEKGPLRNIYIYALQSRILKVPRRHPLYEFFQEPVTSTFALSNTTLAWLWSYLCRKEPQCIVEMGGGRSTVVFALYAQRQKRHGKEKPIVVSIESEREWMEQTQCKLEKYNVGTFINFLCCDLMDNPDISISKHGYLIDDNELYRYLGNKHIDLLLIDGPSGEHGRGATLPCVFDRLISGADVFLDDAKRENEQEAIRNWLEQFRNSLTFKGILPLGSRLAWLKIKKK